MKNIIRNNLLMVHMTQLVNEFPTRKILVNPQLPLPLPEQPQPTQPPEYHLK